MRSLINLQDITDFMKLHFLSIKKYTNYVVGLGLFMGALPASAQGFLSGASFRDIAIGIAQYLVTTIIPIIIGIILLYFIWNIAFYIRNMANEKEREQFKKYSINGIIGLFIVLSLWAIIGIFTGMFFSSSPVIPQFPTGQ